MDPIGSDLSSQNVTIDTAKNVAGHLKKLTKKHLFLSTTQYVIIVNLSMPTHLDPLSSKSAIMRNITAKSKFMELTQETKTQTFITTFLEKNAILHVPAVLKFEKGHDGIGEH